MRQNATLFLNVKVPGTITLTAYNRKNNIDLTILKRDANRPETRLNGAEFMLTPLDIASAGVHYPQDAVPVTGTTAGEGEETGKLTFDSLELGYYEIRESRPPEGYVIYGDNAFYIKVTESGITMIKKDMTKTADQWEEVSRYGAVVFESISATADVSNVPGTEFPVTGGHSTGLIYLLGVMLTGLASAGLVMRRRKTAA